jgi:hypothetical protein
MSNVLNDDRLEDVSERVRDSVRIVTTLYIDDTRVARIETKSIESLEEELYKLEDAIGQEITSAFWEATPDEIDYDELAKEDRMYAAGEL